MDTVACDESGDDVIMDGMDELYVCEGDALSPNTNSLFVVLDVNEIADEVE
jgi:hypothetical protein